MGSFDISRINFNPKKHFAGVRMQQGRVLTDDDWNENEKIENEDRRRSRVDIIGPYGSPDNGFKIQLIPTVGSLIDAGRINFLIKAGNIYLGGWRFELEEDETYRLQKDWLQQPAALDPAPAGLISDRFDLVFLETWLQPISAVEDSSLFEVALGGPDTTTRIRAMQRIRLASGLDYCDCADAWQQVISKWTAGHAGQINQEFEKTTDARLTVSFADAGLPEHLCTPTAAGGYLGAENQAIRVQLTDASHFTWGFDDAAPLYRVTVSADGKKVHMLTEPKDQYHWPLSNQVIEILPWSAMLPNGEKIAEVNGYLTKVDASYNPDTGDFTLVNALPAGFGADWKSRSDKNDLANQTPPDYFYARVWNRGNDLNSPEQISFTSGAKITLGNTGLQVSFTGTEFIAGDYWVIAARPETPDRVVPWELEKGIRPHGIRRYYAPLAVIRWQNVGGQVQGEIMSDCRKKFNPLTDQECCCTYTVGDGVRSKGDFSSIQEAVDNLPAYGGKICVLAGEHEANVIIKGRRQVRISGCGDQTIVRPNPDLYDKPIFLIQNSQRIQIEQLTLVAIDGICIQLEDSKESKMDSERITINDNRMIAGIQAINIHTREDYGGANLIDISHNEIGMLDRPEGKPAIFCLADDVLIERNRIVVIPDQKGDDPDDPRDPNDPGDPFNPCRDKKSPQRGILLKYQIYVLIRYVTVYNPLGRYVRAYLADGGIQIGGTSEKVWILENEIIGGKGNGITLGHLPESSLDYNLKYRDTKIFYSSLYDIKIDGNRISQMGLSGISTLLIFGIQQFIHVEDLTIYRNIIKYCASQLPAEIPGNLLNDWAFGGVILGECDNGHIQENRIEDNGRKQGDAICGVFVLHGEKMIISGNTVIRNGMSVTTPTDLVKTGARGGIVVKMAFKSADLKELLGATLPSFDGVPAVSVFDNIVEQPLGHALLLTAMGPVSVVDNQFTSLATDRTNPLSVRASTVFIFDIGISKDLLAQRFLNIANSSPSGIAKLASNPAYQAILQALQYLPSGKVMFNDNQTTLDMRAPTSNISLSSQLIASLDDISFNSNQSECAGYLSTAAGNKTFDLVLINTVLFGASLRSNDNRFLEGFTITQYSLLSYALMNTATGNQSTHCILVLGNLRAVNSNIVLLNQPCKDRAAAAGTKFAVPAGMDF